MEQSLRAVRRHAGELAAAAVITALLLPNLAALVVPYESFPYTSAQMFAHYKGPGTPLYRLRMIAEPADGRPEREVHAADLGLNGVSFSRTFFGDVYGSIDPYSPFGHHPGDTPRAFEERLGRYFGHVTAVLARRDTAGAWGRLAGLRLEAVRLDQAKRDAEVHVVGRYDAATRRFVHQWGREP